MKVSPPTIGSLAMSMAASTLLVFLSCRESPDPVATTGLGDAGARDGSVSPELARQLAELEAREQAVAASTWAPEMEAQRHGRVLEMFWDALNATSNKLALVAQFPFREIAIDRWPLAEALPHGISQRLPSGETRVLSGPEWRQFIDDIAATGWELVQVEFRHNQFDPPGENRAASSRFHFAAHAIRRGEHHAAVVEGTLKIEWEATGDPVSPPSIGTIDGTALTIRSRQSPPIFELIFEDIVSPPRNAYSIDPLIARDLAGDGSLELILAGRNLVIRQQSNNTYVAERLGRFVPDLISTAVMADFDGDGWTDLLCMKHEGLVIVSGTVEGTFDSPERMAWPAPPDLKYPMALTCGDIDLDGDLDVFVAQYKVLYEDGTTPTPYFDANDGYPAYLLLNDGAGSFTDGTTQRGLAGKRFRRTYTASFADLDHDADLDLLVVSDFAGIDLYRNDGTGHFRDVTEELVSETHAFGMGHVLADFNRDGRIDLFMGGMTSPAVNRLEHLGLLRAYAFRDETMRARMAHGNRLYLVNSAGNFEEVSAQLGIASSGWSWGCSAFDLDNDSYPELYVANGLESRATVSDYESEFWLHDIYVGDSPHRPEGYLYFMSKFARTRGRGQSYGGFDKNRLYLNRGGRHFIEIAHLLGLALEQDSRNVLGEDLDGDGRVDLVVTTYENWPASTQRLHIYRNVMPDPGAWIGFDLREEGRGRSAVGARVELFGDGFSAVRHVVTGDSYRSQHSTRAHFGVGNLGSVREAVITWPGGRSIRLSRPALNCYHPVSLKSEQ